eukprot:11189432-Lingulodinium_polyedra.AAC.1
MPKLACAAAAALLRRLAGCAEAWSEPAKTPPCPLRRWPPRGPWPWVPAEARATAAGATVAEAAPLGPGTALW